VARVDEKNAKQGPSKAAKTPDKNVANAFGLGGLLGGLGGLIEKLGELAEAGEELSRSGDLKDASGKIRGVYGINVKTGLGDRGQTELKVEPFGNVRSEAPARPMGEDVREPLVDVFEEDDHVLVLMELPGVGKDDVHLTSTDGRLDVSARRGNVTYRTQVKLPDNCAAEQMSWECHNGILQARFDRQAI
jgi:HSP20 family protein